MSFKNEFICNFCHKIQKQPTYLPCRCSSICKQHTSPINNENRASITCNECHKTFDITGAHMKDFFKENEPLRKLIENDFHFSDDEKRIKSILTQCINDLENDTDRLKEKCAEFSLIQYDHFANIRREIDIKRETIIQEMYECGDETKKDYNDIHSFSAEMIRQVECVEEAFRLNFNMVKLNLVDIDIEDEKANLSEFMRNPYLTKESVESFKSNLILKLELTRRKISTFKLFDYDLNKNTFHPDTSNTFAFKSFGKLELSHEFLTELSNEIQNVITCSFNSANISVWNLNTSSMIKSLKGHTSGIRCLTLLEKSKLISGGKDKQIKIWDLLSGECLETLVGHTDEIYCLRVLDGSSQAWPGGKGVLASGSDDIKIWELKTFSCLYTLRGHTWYVFCLEKLSNEYLISGSRDKSIRIWDLRNKNHIKILKGHAEDVRCLKVLSNNLFASGSVDTTIRIWEGFSGECVRALVGHSGWVNYLDILVQATSTSDLLVSCSSDQTIRIWDLTNEGRCVRVLHTHHTPEVNCIKLISSRQLITGSYNQNLKIWDLNTGECVQTIATDSSIWKFEFCSDAL